jgi:antitoxin component YwqK of YwqJK toxin-antitoxin module
MKDILRVSGFFMMALSLLAVSSCGSARYNSDYNLNQARLKGNVKADVLALADTSSPDISQALAVDSSAAQKTEKKKKKASKRYFFGYKVKRGFVKSGPRGGKQTLETFSYLPEYQEPNPYAPMTYVFDTKKHTLYRTSGEIDPDRYKLLHGPYKKKIGDQVVEEGYFYAGTKHLRWEYYKRDEEGTLRDKEHYDKGFPRDAVVTYYDGPDKKIKEVMPYEFGEVQGTYYRFYPNGQVEWSGQYDKGRRIGVWINYYDFRGRRHYEFQYPKTAYEPRTEPYLIKEYDRHGTLIFEKDKFDKRSQAQR